MEIQFQQSTTPGEYRELVQRYSFLVDAEMQRLEESPDTRYLADRLPQLISAVNVIGYLRGQDNMFVEERPPLDFQSALYRNEDAFERRLSALVAKVMSSPSAEEYQAKLKRYYFDFRTQSNGVPNEGTV